MTGHVPVMVAEVLATIGAARGGLFIDCTVGLGGHAAAMLEAGATRVVGLDRDPTALEQAARHLHAFGSRVTLVHADYRDLGAVLDARGIDLVDGVLADLGVSSWQLDAPARGFSFRSEGPLDMRMDPTVGATAADYVATASEADLAEVIFTYGEERFARRIARAIVRARSLAPILTTTQLAAIVRRAVPVRGRQRIDPATRTFQALRIRVNRELDRLDVFLREAAARLRALGRLVVIAFHSLEDRTVKRTFRALAAGEPALWRVLTPKPLTPGPEECARNPRARSARLRAVERAA